MPVDPNIILGIKPPQFDNQVDLAAKGMQMQQMGMQNQMQQRAMADDQATRQAYANAMVAGPNGAPTLDKQKLLSSLPPMLAHKTQQELAANDSAQAKSQMEVSKNEREMHASELGQVLALPPDQKQAGYTALRQKNIAAGLPGAANSPEQYPGDAYIYQGMAALMGPKDQLALKEKQQEFASREADRQVARERNEIDKGDKLAGKMQDHLDKGWTARSGAAGKVQGKITDAEYAEGLIAQGKGQPNGLDSRQLEELAQSTARLLGGTGAASARVEALVPHTLMGRAQTLKEYLSNNPTGANAQAFVDRMAETIAREKQIAENQKRQFQIEGLPRFKSLKNKDPDTYNAMLQGKGITSDMIDDKGRYKAPGATPFHSMSDDALDAAYKAAGGK